MYTPPQDKVLHFAAGTVAASAGLIYTLLLRLAGADVSAAVGAALGCAAAALGREVYNRAHAGAFDWRDIAATLAGGLPVVMTAAWGSA